MVEMVTTSVYTSGRSQVVRLPKAFETTAKRMKIRKRGEDLVLTPVEEEDQWAFLRKLREEMTEEDRKGWDEVLEILEEARRREMEEEDLDDDFSDWYEPEEGNENISVEMRWGKRA